MEGTTLLAWSSPQTLLIAGVLALLVMALLYLARAHAHQLLRDGTALITRLSRRLGRAGRAGNLANRRQARRALVQLAREAAERRLSRQTQRLGATLSRDLASFPHLHRQLHEQIRHVDEDYRSTVEAPPTPPEWLEAIETITRLPAREDPSVGRMLEDLRATLDRACHEALLAYRRASHRRHRVLKRMQPLWRRMDRNLGSVDHTMRRLQSHTDRLDQQIDEYTRIVTGHDNIVRRLAANLGPRCGMALLGLAGVGLAAAVTFQLIALPLDSMAVGSGTLGGIALHQVIAASMLVLVALGGGLLLDTLRVTQLFPEASWLDPRARRGLAIAAGVMVGALLFAIAALAWTRDYLEAIEQTSQALANSMLLLEQPIVEPPAFRWLPALIHSLIALGLGGIVATAALPLDTLIRQGRVLALGAAALLCQAVALLGDLTAIIAVQLRRLIAGLYDLVIIIPLALQAGYYRARERASPARRRADRQPEPYEPAMPGDPSPASEHRPND
jgi:hypothetical protein